jgi:16S rRNA processing protein RimM
VAEGAYLAVARVRKPHGLHGEVVVWVLTDEPERVFAPGAALMPVGEDGKVLGEPVVVERSRPYHRQWLLKFVGADDRTTVESWRERVLGATVEVLRPPKDNELYVHEIPGAAVWSDGRPIGVAKELLESPGGALLSIEVEGREVLVPFRAPILQGVVRDERRIDLALPDGLLEL